MAARTYKTDAIVLRSLRFSEADRILHLYSDERGRIGAIAKGVRKTKSRFGARLEPLSHSSSAPRGWGELQTITGVELLRSHHAVREDNYRLNVGLIGAEAMLRLFGEPEANERAFGALVRFLDLLDESASAAGRPAVDPLVLSFQLKLLWLAGYLPHLTSCVECGSDARWWRSRPGREAASAPLMRQTRCGSPRRASTGSSASCPRRSRTPRPPASRIAHGEMRSR